MKSLAITLRSDVNLFYDADIVAAAKNGKEQTNIIVRTFSMMMLMMIKVQQFTFASKILTFLVGKMYSLKTIKIVMTFLFNMNSMFNAQID